MIISNAHKAEENAHRAVLFIFEINKNVLTIVRSMKTSKTH
jgi:hypothetical protein